MYLKWLSAEHIYITPEGRLQVGGLAGAVFADYNNSNLVAANSVDSGSGGNSGSAGGVLTSSSTSAGEGEEQFSICALADKLSEQKSQQQQRQKDKETSSSSSSSSNFGGGSRNRRKVKLGMNFDDEEEDDDEEEGDHHHGKHSKNKHHMSKLDRIKALARKLSLPRGSLYTVAPEVVLGAPPSPESTVFSAAAVCAQLLTGKPLVKVKLIIL